MKPTKNIAFIFVLTAVFWNCASLAACPNCRPIVESSVYNRAFAGNLLLLLSPLMVLCAIGIGLHFSDAIAAKFQAGKGAK